MTDVGWCRASGKPQKLLFLAMQPKVSCYTIFLTACALHTGALLFSFILPCQFAPIPLAAGIEAMVGQTWTAIPLSGTASEPAPPTPALVPPEKGGCPASPATAPPACRPESARLPSSLSF